ncbi:hypothetical protein MRX96_017774 [Rhipicephalus microplus]
MLSNAEETLTDTDKASAIGASSNPNATSLPITAHNNDQQLGEGIDEKVVLRPLGGLRVDLMAQTNLGHRTLGRCLSESE